MTEDQIERIVELRTDRIDAAYMADQLTTEEYNQAMRELAEWAERRYAEA